MAIEIITETTKKKCSKCKATKGLTEFSKNSCKRDGLDYSCKECIKDYHRTKLGLLAQMYNSQKQSSKRRKHPMPTYSREEFLEAILAMPLFHTLYSTWVTSNYKLELVPSIDRLEDDLPYTEDNIQLGTWKENKDKEVKVQSKPVVQLSLTGVAIKYFESINSAARELDLHKANISGVCSGRYKTAGGYKFRYR